MKVICAVCSVDDTSITSPVAGAMHKALIHCDHTFIMTRELNVNCSPMNSTGDCGMTMRARRTSATPNSRRSSPSMTILPLSTSVRRKSVLKREDLPGGQERQERLRLESRHHFLETPWDW